MYFLFARGYQELVMLLGILICTFLIASVVSIQVQTECTFPTSLHGDWVSSDKGALSINETHISGYDHRIPSPILPTSMTFYCVEKRNSTYWLRAHEEDIIFGLDIIIHTCLEFHQVSDDTFYYYIGKDFDFFVQENVYIVLSNEPPPKFYNVCDRAKPYYSQSYITLIKEDLVTSDSVSTACPYDLRAVFSNISIENASERRICAISFLNGCNKEDILELTFDPSCEKSTFSYTNQLRCLFHLSTVNGTFVSLLNLERTVDNTDTVQQICLAYKRENNTLFATMTPNYCDATSSPYFGLNEQSYKFASIDESCNSTKLTTSTSSTTAATTMSLSTTPAPCLDNRTDTAALFAKCGFHSATTICRRDGSACLTTVQDPDDWRCRCTKGFIRQGNFCIHVSVQSGLLSPEASATVNITDDRNVTMTVHRFRYSLEAIPFQSSSCRVSYPSLFSCTSTQLGLYIYINNLLAFKSEDVNYRVAVQGIVQIDDHTLLGDAVLYVNIEKPVIRLSAIIVDSSFPDQFVLHVPVRSNESLTLNSTYFTINNNMDIIVAKDISTVYPKSTIFYSMTIAVSEGNGKDLALVDIYVVRNSFITSVPENTKPMIASIINNKDINLIIQGPNDDSFTIVNDNLILASLFDYESMPTKILTVEILFTLNTTGQSAICGLTVEITDEDDVGPKFPDRVARVTITQSALETFVMNLNANDVDTSELIYTIPPQTSDFVIKRGYELWKTSASNGSTVSVTVSDQKNADDVLQVMVNVERPVSEALNNTFLAEIDEEKPAGTFVTYTNVTGYEDFQFLDNNALNYFRLDNSTGRVTFAKKIDRENDTGLVNDKLIYPIRGTEKGTSCSFVKIGKLSVLIKDINDEPPVFKHTSYTGSVTEGKLGAYIQIQPLIEIEDKDLDATNVFTFSLSNFQNDFQIEQTAGGIQIKTKRKLDREKRNQFLLSLGISDGNHSVRTNISVQVLDINDNSPEYKNSSKRFSVKENAELGTVVTTLLFEDKDEGLNGEISFTDDSGYFTVSRSGVLTVDGPLDRETISSHNISVTACDRGQNHICTVIELVIDILDENDNAPTFVSPSDLVPIREDYLCNPTKTIIMVIFDDKDDGIFGQMTFKIKSSGLPFEINSSSGALYCRGNLDYDNVSSTTVFEVEVEACDGGSPPNCTSETIFIEITDVNDNDPVFLGDFASGSYSVSVEMRDFDKSKPIALVSVTDADSGDNGKVSFVKGSGNGWTFMQINTDNGLISTIASSTKPHEGLNYTLVVMAHDNGQTRRTNNVTVYYTVAKEQGVVEFRDNDIQETVVEESLHIDIDLSRNITNGSGISLTYDIPGAEQGFVFEVDQTSGRLSLKRKLDREIKDQYLFPVRAYYDKSSTLALVTINVTDINDNKPLIPSTLPKAKLLKENAKEGYTILKVTAVDADIGQNAITHFELTSMDQPDYCKNSFNLNRTSGQLILVQTIDFDVLHNSGIQTYCGFSVKAVDSGNTALYTSTTLTIEVIDVNDNAPEFVGENTAILVEEKSPTTSEFKWSAYVTDKDMKGGQNGDFDVRITNAEECRFAVKTRARKKGDNDKDVLFRPLRDAKLDFETTKEIQCNLTVTDKGSNSLFNSTLVTIKLVDVNDNDPKVIGEPYTTNISRYAIQSYVVFTGINASDSDSGENAEIQFTKDETGTAKNAWDFFSISSTTGQITVTGSLPSLSTDVAVLFVNVSDKGTPTRWIRINMTIYIEDDNQRPYFTNKQINISLIEETQYGQTSLLPVQALDKDKTTVIQCDCIYNVTTHTDLFELHTRADGTHVVLLRDNVTLDRETQPTYVVEVIATDKGEPAKETDRPLTIIMNLTDINDNAPKFQYPYYNKSIFQNYPLNTSFFRVVAVDPDIGNNAITKYSLMELKASTLVDSAMNTSIVTIDTDTGELSLNSSANFDTTDTYHIDLTVKATDADKMSYYDIAVIRVIVNYDDPNKNTPAFITPETYRKEIDLVTIKVNDVVLNVAAFDNDTGADGAIVYRIQSGNIRDTFSLHQTSGDLALKYPVDAVVKDQIKLTNQLSLTLIAVDGGVIPKTGTAVINITVKGEAMPCGLLQTSDPLEDQSTYQTVMYVLIAVTCLLLITNAIFISLYCRRKPQKLRRGDPYTTDKRISSKHLYDDSVATWHQQHPGERWNETENQAYDSNQQVLRLNPPFSDALRQRLDPAMPNYSAPSPPSLPQRPTAQEEPFPDYDSPSNEGTRELLDQSAGNSMSSFLDQRRIGSPTQGTFTSS